MAFPDFSPLELRILDHIQNFTDAEAHVFVENGETVVDMAVYPPCGGDLPPSITMRLQAGNYIRLFHNHPSGSSISPDDLNILAQHPTLEIFAVTPTGSVHGGRLIDQFQAQALQKQLSKLRDLDAVMGLMINPSSVDPLGSADIPDVDRVASIYRNQRLYEIGAFEFYCAPSAHDGLITAMLFGSALRKSWRKVLRVNFP